MTVAECLQRWRALPQAERQRRRWQRIPRHVAASMAFEGEPVELAWLQQLHRFLGPPNSQAVIGVHGDWPARHFGSHAVLEVSGSSSKPNPSNAPED